MPSKVSASKFAESCYKIYSNHVPYVNGGYSLKSCDCRGVVMFGLIDNSVPVPVNFAAGTNTSWRTCKSLINKRQVTSIDDTSLMPGTLIYTRKPITYGDGTPSWVSDNWNYSHVRVVYQTPKFGGSFKLISETGRTTGCELQTSLGSTSGNRTYWAAELSCVDYSEFTKIPEVPSKEDPIDDGGIHIMTELYRVPIKTSGGHLNLRSTSDPKSSVLTEIPNETIVPVYEESNQGTLHVIFEGTEGWISKAYTDQSKKTYASVPKIGVYVPCTSLAEAEALVSLLKNASVLNEFNKNAT